MITAFAEERARDLADDREFRVMASTILFDKPTWTETCEKLARWDLGITTRRTLSASTQEAFRLLYGQVPKRWGDWTVIG
jgi:hypothetical protein